MYMVTPYKMVRMQGWLSETKGLEKLRTSESMPESVQQAFVPIYASTGSI